MTFGELISSVKNRSGFSYEESKDALELLVESLAVHLTEPERRHFASQLPQELQDMALSVMATAENSRQDMVEQFVQMGGVDVACAKKQILSAWAAIKQAISPGEINHIKSQLPNSTTSFLG